MSDYQFDAVTPGTCIQSYLSAHALQRTDHERIGPFFAGFALQDANPYLNYTVPDDAAEPTRADIDRLVAAFERRKRKPRLEYIPHAASEVEAALLAAGFIAENRFISPGNCPNTEKQTRRTISALRTPSRSA
jgi:hypothetical protein